MLAAITDQLRDELQTRLVPLSVVYGPERTIQGSTARPHIVVERDRQQGDTFGAAPTHSRNPELVFRRGIGAVVRIFAESTVSGAGQANHERMADKVVNQILLALREIIIARKTDFRIKAARFLTVDELAEAGLTYPGVVYELRLEVDMGVTDMAYDDEAAGEAEYGDTWTSVSTTLDTSDSPEPTTDLPGASTR